MRTENRHSTRIEKTLNAVVEHFASDLPDDQSKEVHVQVHDVSREGIGFLSREPFDRDAVVRVTIDFGHDTGAGRKFTVEGVVRVCSTGPGGGFRVGLLLKERTNRELQTWHDLIQRWRSFVS